MGAFNLIRVRRLWVATAAASAIIAFFSLGLHRYLTLETIRDSRTELEGLYRARPAVWLAGYIAAYVGTTALLLPFTTVLTLAAGAIFGFWTGFAAVSLASTAGAALAFLTTRYVLRQWVQSRFGSRLAPINDSLSREGAVYLAALRLAPAIPFPLVNAAMGLTPISLWTYTWVSMISMLPGLALYVNVGTRLGQLNSLQDLSSPSLIASLVVLGIFPVAARRAVAWWKSAR